MATTSALTKILGRRTNSLAFAKTDCHTCSELGRWCDRQRPQCGACSSHLLKCGGFILDLSWNVISPGPSSIVGNTREPRPPAHQRLFKFKKGRPRRKRKGRTHADRPALPQPIPELQEPCSSSARRNSSSEPNATPEIVAGNHIAIHAIPSPDLGDSWVGLDENWHPNFDSQPWATTPSWIPFDEEPRPNSPGFTDSTVEDTHVFPAPRIQNSLGPSLPLDLGDSEHRRNAASGLEFEVFRGDELAISTTIPSEESRLPFNNAWNISPHGVLYTDLQHKLSAVLTMYDAEFCILPLTIDCNANPFRISQETSQASQFLLHSILAISMQHLAKKSHNATLATEMLTHRSTATHLYRKALSKTNPLALLDTLLIMVNLDATQSAFGSWDVHLMGALKLLESAGGVEVCKMSSRHRAQIAMLVWWDITIALMARQEPIFPLQYLETLLKYDCNDGWTFFILNGCPGEFVHAMSRLSTLATVYEKVASLNCEWTSFNLFPIKAIVEEVKNWKNNDDSNHEDITVAGDVNARRDRFHCNEAWRYAIILYTKRVFTKKLDLQGLQSTSYLARVILDHIRCIKKAAIIQKQVLIPIFLAAAEFGDEADRVFVRQYCQHWSASSRYSMFETAEMVIERIWADWHVETRDTHWWGAVVGNGSSYGRQDQPMANLFLLG